MVLELQEEIHITKAEKNATFCEEVMERFNTQTAKAGESGKS